MVKAVQVTAYRYLIRIPGVCGGKAIIEGTRPGVHEVIGLLFNGETGETTSQCFPNVKKSQVPEGLAYYEDQRGGGKSTTSLLSRRAISDPDALSLWA